MDADGNDQQQERTVYITLIGIFLGLFAAFSKQEQAKHSQLKVSALDLAMLGLTTFRTGRLAAYDQVTQPLRKPFTTTESDSYGTSQTTVAKGSGARRALGELAACPTCIGTWVAAFLVYGLRVAPGPTRLFLAFMSAARLAEILDSANEALSWTGSAERKQAKSSSK
jgi:hypothetical protein